MSELDDENILVDTSLQGSFHELLEKGDELAKLSHLGELVLEELPYFVRLFVIGLLRAQEDDILHLFIELLV